MGIERSATAAQGFTPITSGATASVIPVALARTAAVTVPRVAVVVALSVSVLVEELDGTVAGTKATVTPAGSLSALKSIDPLKPDGRKTVTVTSAVEARVRFSRSRHTPRDAAPASRYSEPFAWVLRVHWDGLSGPADTGCASICAELREP